MTTMLKRDRLIEAAKAKFYQQGVARTTLADIAQQAQVPLGNVYYHFRTKEALVEAVVQAHTQELHAMFGKWELIADPFFSTVISKLTNFITKESAHRNLKSVL